jgi:TetR/AcrR family transcriptional repressor of nem operon
MSIGRPIEFDRDQALNRALNLFWAQGYRKTSLQDLCDEMRLSKSSLYSSFGDKKAVFLKSIQAYSAGLLQEFERLARTAKDPRQFLQSVLQDLTDEAATGKERRGCLVMNTATEFAQTDPDVAKIVERTIEKMRTIVESALEDGRRRGLFKADLDPKAMSFFMVSTIAGMKTMVKAGRSRSELANVARLFLVQL